MAAAPRNPRPALSWSPWPGRMHAQCFQPADERGAKMNETTPIAMSEVTDPTELAPDGAEGGFGNECDGTQARRASFEVALEFVWMLQWKRKQTPSRRTGRPVE